MVSPPAAVVRSSGLRPTTVFSQRSPPSAQAWRSPCGTRRHDALGTGYAVAIPTSAFLVLLWLSHSAIVPRSQVRASVVFGGAVLVLLAPLVGAGAGVGVVAALIALVAAATVAATIVCSRTRRHPLRVIEG